MGLQFIEQILNKIVKTFNDIFAILKHMLQRFPICVCQNLSCKAMESPIQPNSGQISCATLTARRKDIRHKIKYF